MSLRSARWSFSFVFFAALLLTFPARADFASGAEAYDSGNYAQAYREWISLARRGNAMAQIAIANMYRHGEGRRPDAAKAAVWYQRAAKSGNPIAQVNLAELYETGAGVEKDMTRAVFWYSCAADAGNDWAANQIKRLKTHLSADMMARTGKISTRCAESKPK